MSSMCTYYSSAFKGIAFQSLPTMTIVLFGPTYSPLFPFLINTPRFLFQDFPNPLSWFVPGVTRLPTGLGSDLSSSVQSCPVLSPTRRNYFRDLGGYSYLAPSEWCPGRYSKTGEEIKQRAWNASKRTGSQPEFEDQTQTGGGGGGQIQQNRTSRTGSDENA